MHNQFTTPSLLYQSETHYRNTSCPAVADEKKPEYISRKSPYASARAAYKARKTKLFKQRNKIKYFLKSNDINFLPKVASSLTYIKKFSSSFLSINGTSIHSDTNNIQLLSPSSNSLKKKAENIKKCAEKFMPKSSSELKFGKLPLSEVSEKYLELLRRPKKKSTTFVQKNKPLKSSQPVIIENTLTKKSNLKPFYTCRSMKEQPKTLKNSSKHLLHKNIITDLIDQEVEVSIDELSSW
ncbi:hypothetical protein SteCoe_17013 [Stentor coeruleus]|uniref:Uncharacterized protein n=1 Tax=Stentor coeruleus TaxID=5963 RepID=A0A1R2C008_9CILI|nr:hypothetical protein SteCoe_17013 [Stentor coeruleus]